MQTLKASVKRLGAILLLGPFANTMAAPKDIEIWLATQGGTGPRTLVPYVKTVDGRKLAYKIEVLKNGASGTSRLEQAGLVSTEADTPTALSHVQMSVDPGDECTVKVDLSDGTLELGQFAFDCQPKR